MKRLAAAVNAAFWKAYPSATDLYKGQNDEEDEDILVRRVSMLIDDLLCTRQNWHITNEAYCKLDCKHRSIREYWWQFWRSWKKYQCAPMPERRRHQAPLIVVERRKNGDLNAALTYPSTKGAL